MHKLPSQKLADLLNGRTAWDDADDSIRSWATFFIFKSAEGILKLPKEKRRAAIDRAPVSVRPHLEAEIIRIFQHP